MGNNNKIHSRLSVDITANNRTEVLSAIVASFNGKLLSHQRSGKDVACSLSPFYLSPDLKHSTSFYLSSPFLHLFHFMCICRDAFYRGATFVRGYALKIR